MNLPAISTGSWELDQKPPQRGRAGNTPTERRRKYSTAMQVCGKPTPWLLRPAAGLGRAAQIVMPEQARRDGAPGPPGLSDLFEPGGRGMLAKPLDAPRRLLEGKIADRPDVRPFERHQ